MANMTDSLENKVVDGVSGVTTLLSSTMYLALFTADPTDTGSVINELSGNGYTRIALTGKFPSASGGTASNNVLITSAIATANWPAVTHVGYCRSGTPATDDMEVWALLSSPVIVLNGGTFEVPIGGLTLVGA